MTNLWNWLTISHTLVAISHLWWNKTEILLNCSCVNPIVWLHLLDLDKVLLEKARWVLHKDAMCCLEQILEAVLYKTALVPPLASHLTNHARWVIHAEHSWRNKEELISELLLWTTVHGSTSVDLPLKTYIYQLCADTEWHLEYLPKEIDDRDGWWERTKRIHVISMWCS